MSYRLTIERRHSQQECTRASCRPYELRTMPLATRADLTAAMAVVQDFVQQAKEHAECRSVTLVLHQTDCDHEP